MNNLIFTKDEIIGCCFFITLTLVILSFIAGRYMGYLDAKEEQKELDELNK